MTTTSRRAFLRNTAVAAGVLPIAAIADTPLGDRQPPLPIMCVGGHPDDPESGCGGTLAKLKAAGHTVTIVYLTRGEAGIKRKTHDEAAAIRTKEAESACRILQAKPLFFGQIDGESVFDNSAVKKMEQLFATEKPAMVFAHWPVDSHKDHQAASLITVQAWMKSVVKPALYFYEVCTGEQTMTFRPTDYVDISPVQETKKQAVYCHVSQNPEAIYTRDGHALMERFRGAEIGVAAAEAFVRMTGERSQSII